MSQRGSEVIGRQPATLFAGVQGDLIDQFPMPGSREAPCGILLICYQGTILADAAMIGATRKDERWLTPLQLTVRWQTRLPHGCESILR